MNLASLEASSAQSTHPSGANAGLRRFWIAAFLAIGAGISLLWMMFLGLLLGYGLLILLNYVF